MSSIQPPVVMVSADRRLVRVSWVIRHQLLSLGLTIPLPHAEKYGFSVPVDIEAGLWQRFTHPELFDEVLKQVVAVIRKQGVEGKLAVAIALQETKDEVPVGPEEHFDLSVRKVPDAMGGFSLLIEQYKAEQKPKA